MQNRTIKIINLKSLKDHAKMNNNLYKSLNILQIKIYLNLKWAKLCTLFNIEFFPENFNYFFSSVSKNLNYHTKSVGKRNFFIPRMNTRYGHSACTHTGAKVMEYHFAKFETFV